MTDSSGEQLNLESLGLRPGMRIAGVVRTILGTAAPLIDTTGRFPAFTGRMPCQNTDTKAACEAEFMFPFDLPRADADRSGIIHPSVRINPDKLEVTIRSIVDALIPPLALRREIYSGILGNMTLTRIMAPDSDNPIIDNVSDVETPSGLLIADLHPASFQLVTTLLMYELHN